MKRFITVTAALILVLCYSEFADAHPGYGWHGDDKGNGELVLEYDLARDLAQSVGRSGVDPVTGNAIRQLVQYSANFSRAVPYVGAAYMITNGLMFLSRAQMRAATGVPNYEAYGFKMKRWVPYYVKRYSYADGTLLREKGDAAVYVVIADAKFWVPKASYFKNKWNRVKIVPRGRLKGWYKYPNTGVLLKEQNNPAVYLIQVGSINPQYTWVSSTNKQGVVRRLISNAAFNRLHFSWSKVRVVPDGAFNNPNPYLPRGYDIR